MPTYATETHELLSLPKGWLTRSGTGIIFGIVLLSLLTAHFIRYPELAVAPVTVYGKEAKIDLFPKQNGRLWHIAAQHGDSVKKNELLFVLESTTDWQAALRLANWLEEAEGDIPDFEGLGALQNDFEVFRERWRRYQVFLQDSVYEKSLAALQKEAELQDSLLRMAQKKYRLLAKDEQFLRRKMKSDSLLFRDGVISLEDWEQSQRAAFLQRQNLLQNKESQLAIQLRKQQLESQQAKLLQERFDTRRSLAAQLEQQRTVLAQGLENWSDQYLIRSPVSGTLSFFERPGRFQTLTPQEPLLTVIASSQQTYAYAEIPEAQSRKLEVGNPARIKPEGYPSLEFGSLPARVSALSASPNAEGSYSVRLQLTQGFETTEGKSLPMRPQTSGTVEILLEERSLLEHLFTLN